MKQDVRPDGIVSAMDGRREYISKITIFLDEPYTDIIIAIYLILVGAVHDRELYYECVSQDGRTTTNRKGNA